MHLWGWHVYIWTQNLLYSREAVPHPQRRPVPPCRCPEPLTGPGWGTPGLAVGWAAGRSESHQEPLWGCALSLPIAGHCAWLWLALSGSGAALWLSLWLSLCWLSVGSGLALHGATLPILPGTAGRYCADPVLTLCRVLGARWVSTGLSSGLSTGLSLVS